MKRILLLIAALLLLIVFAVNAAAGTARFVGDVNNDGVVTAEDARVTLRASVGMETLPGELLARADLDADGKLSSADARLVLRISVGLETPAADPGFSARKTAVVDTADLYTYADLEEDLALLRSLFPSRFSYRSVGTTADGREIFCAVVGSGRGSKQVLADAGIHGSEYLNPAAVMSAVEYCLRNYDLPVWKGKTVREILFDTDICLFPMLNPDGIAISQFGLEGLHTPAVAAQVKAIYDRQARAGNAGGGLASYLRVWKANANGVDLNRNFLFERTGISYDTGVYEPANEEYAGDRRKPEAETAAYRSVCNSLSHPVAVLSIHSQGNLIYWDCCQSAAGRAAAKKLAMTVKAVTGYRLDWSNSFMGASADWTMIEKGIPSVTVECGSGHNPLPLFMQAVIGRSLRDLFLAVAEQYA